MTDGLAKKDQNNFQKKNRKVFRNKKILLLAIVLITSITIGTTLTSSHSKDIVIAESFSKEEVLSEKKYAIESGDTFTRILEENGNLSPEEVSKALESVQEVFDVTKIPAGSVMRFLFAREVFASVEFDLDKENSITLKKGDSHFVSDIMPIEYTQKEAESSGIIEDSFYLEGTSSGLTDKAIMDIVQIFSWDIDFATNIQSGDSFSVIYDNTYREGVFIGVGDIKAVRFTNEGKDYFAFMVKNEDGTRGYYNELGESTKKALLKTPLNFTRISSNFSYSRKNPVNGSFASHRAVDLAAPTGTPIESVGDGVVEQAGWNGGYGKYIRIRHSNGFKTAYAHLSSISSGVKKGSTVAQGQLIGAVGSTGNSTGPHLHYEVWKDGNPVNPFNVDLPSGEPINDSERDSFNRIMQKYIDQISL